jgi:hypothetical protein
VIFLREYWAWILAPIVLVALGLALLILFGGGGEPTSPFVYTIH